MKTTLRIEAGATYRLMHDLEVRDEATGTLKAYLRKGTLLVVKKVDDVTEHVWVEGVDLPLPLDALPYKVERA